MTRATVSRALGPLYATTEIGATAAYGSAEADGIASGLPFVDSCQPHPASSVVPGVAPQARPAAATPPAPAPNTGAVTYAASYSTSVIETPAAQAPSESRPGAGFSWAPNYGKR
jgi:hypothetical protein